MTSEYVGWGNLREVEKQKESEASPSDSSRPDMTRQPEPSPVERSRQSVEPARARPATRQPKTTRQLESDREPELTGQAISARRPLLDGLEHASHFSSFTNSVVDRLLPTLPPAAQLAYLQLYRLSYGNRRNWCRIGNPRLAERCGIGESTLKRALAVLEKRALVEVVEYRFGGDERGTTYYVPVPPDTPDGAIGQAKSDRQVRTSRQPDPGRQVESESMKDSETHGEKGDVYQIRVVAARLFEAHRSEPGFNHARLRELVRDALIGQGIAVDEGLIEAALASTA